jgi:hypothetical protein
MAGIPPAQLDYLRTIPFVRDITYSAASHAGDFGSDGELSVVTPQGSFAFTVEVKRSFLSNATVHQLLAWLRHRGGGPDLIIFARHISRPAAEALIANHVNFVDEAGNVHLKLGYVYFWTKIGMPAPSPMAERRAPSPAQLQLLFQFVIHPQSVNLPVRSLEIVAGVSKSKAAQTKRAMLAEGLLVRASKEYRLGPSGMLAERLLSGYAQVLRPKLVVGRFRPPEKTSEQFLDRLRISVPSNVRYALTGGAAAAVLQHFYRGPETTIFLEPWDVDTIKNLRLLPDREGPVTILRAFGDVVFGKQHGGHTVAPPWLVYAELLNTDDPRAQEAAQEFRQQFLV